MLPLPSLVSEEILDRKTEIIAVLFHVQDRDVIIRDLGGHHPAADLGFANLFLLSLDGPWREGWGGAWDQERAAGGKEVVARQAVEGA